MALYSTTNMVFMNYKYIITRTTKSTIEVKPDDVDPETIEFLEKCMKNDSSVGFLDEEDETGSYSMNEDLDRDFDLNFDIKKVEEWKFIIKAKKSVKRLLKPVAQDAEDSVEPLRTKEKVVLFARVEESSGKAQMVGCELFMIIILFYIKVEKWK